MNPTTMNEIIQAVQRARKKHPHFADNRFHSVSLAAEELGEFAKAVNEGDASAAHEEAQFVISAERVGFVADFDNYNGVDLEVIGNIHENPELLEEEK